MEPLKLNIRPATEADVSKVHQLIVELCVFEKEDPKTVEITENMILEDGFCREKPFFNILVAENEGSPSNVCGFAFYWFSYDIKKGGRMLHLEDLYVQQEYRRRGIGNALLKSIAKIADDKDCVLVDWACLDWNVKAKEFYHKMGAHIDKTDGAVQLTRQQIQRNNALKNSEKT